MILKQSTNYTRKFIMVLNSDHITGATGVTVLCKISNGDNAAFVTSSNAPTELANGWYQVRLNPTDLANPGDTAFHCTGTAGPACDPTDFVDQVQATIFTDMPLAPSGRPYIADNWLQNTSQPQTFQMVDSSTGAPKTGLTVTAQRCLGLGGFAPCANAVVEIGLGIYGITLAPTDTNSSVTGLLFTAPGAANLFMPVVPTP